MSAHDRADRNAGYAFILIFALMAMGIIVTGYLYYQNYERRERTELESQLASIAELKVGELALWSKERLGDGAVLFKNATFSALVRRFLEKPEDTDAQRQLQDWMGKYHTAYQYAEVSLFDAQGYIRMSAPKEAELVDFDISRNVAEILRAGRVVFQDFHRETPDGLIHMAIVVPIFDEPDDSRPLGVLVMDIDPATYLYPFINRWPMPSQTAETLLVRREGNDVLFLNETKFHKNAALNLRIPLTKTEVPSVKAALGQEGVMEGVDYRGAPVIAAALHVPGSPWYLVACMNTSEAYEPVRERLWQTLALVGFLLLGAGAAMELIWRQKDVRYRERDKAEDKLRKSETLMAEAQKVARIGHWEWDIKTDAVTWSDEMFRIHGYEPGAITPSMNALMDTVPPEDRERVSRIIKQSLDGAGRYFMDRVAVKPDGTRRIVHAEGEVERDESGAARRMFAVVQDVTESKENENRMKLFREALDLSSDAVLIMDGEMARPVDFNRAAHEQLGYTHEEMFGLTVLDIVVVKPGSFIWKDWVKEVKESGGLIVERNHRRKDGSVFPVETSLTVVEMEGKEYLVAIVRDRIERVKIRELEIMAKSLELTNRELAEFAHVASHDLQEPLRTIIAFSDRLEAKFGAELSPKSLDYLRRIRYAGMRMSQLLRDLLSYSLVSGGQLNFERVDLNQIVTGVLEDLRGAIEESGARLGVSPLPVVNADPSQMRQMFQNLISNAIKYRKPGEHPDVRISARGIKIPMGKSNSVWEVIVEDDGIGFDNEYAEKIFNVFERLHGHSEYDGTGVGLATALKIVQRHGWTIKAEGKPGAGAKFTILMISLEV